MYEDYLVKTEDNKKIVVLASSRQEALAKARLMNYKPATGRNNASPLKYTKQKI